jgi:hypothetical protein
VRTPPNAIAEWARARRHASWTNTKDAATAAQAKGIGLTEADLKQAEAQGRITDPKRPLFEAFYGPIPAEGPATGSSDLTELVRMMAYAQWRRDLVFGELIGVLAGGLDPEGRQDVAALLDRLRSLAPEPQPVR